MLVLIEYVPYGDLLGYLRKSRQLEDNYFKDPDIKPQTSLTSQQLMKFSWQVADGMHYLSSKNVSWFLYTSKFAVSAVGNRCKGYFIPFNFNEKFQVDEIYLDASDLSMNLFNTLGNPFSMRFSYGDNKAFCLKRSKASIASITFVSLQTITFYLQTLFTNSK